MGGEGGGKGQQSTTESSRDDELAEEVPGGSDN